MERALRDLRLAARSWRRSPALAVAAVVTLAVALGANTALFSLVNAVLLRPLPGIAPADRLVNVRRQTADGTTFLGFSHPDYRDLRERARALDGLAAFNGRGASLGDGTGAPELVGIQLVSGNYFEVLGQGLRLALAGVAAGAAGAVALAPGLRGLLPGVSPTDPLTFVTIALLMTAVALLASYLPARRAARVDPMIALRSE